MECPKCKKQMKNLGHISGITYASNPPQWDEVWVCDDCKVKLNKREHGPTPPDYSYLDDYESLNNTA